MEAHLQQVTLQNSCNRTLLTHRIDNTELKSKIDQIIHNMAVILTIIDSSKKVNWNAEFYRVWHQGKPQVSETVLHQLCKEN